MTATQAKRESNDPAQGESTFLGGALGWLPDFAPTPLADAWLEKLEPGVVWHRPRVRLFGREVLSPRLAAWYGDPAAVYTYSGLRNEPLDWTPVLLEIRRRVEKACAHEFNSVLLNYYRDGGDSMGWHSDDEAGLDGDAPIASVSLGAERRFRLKHRREKGRRLEMVLTHGSLLIMRPPLQDEWRHGVPREPGVDLPRINLTFRSVR